MDANPQKAMCPLVGRGEGKDGFNAHGEWAERLGTHTAGWRGEAARADGWREGHAHGGAVGGSRLLLLASYLG